MWLSINSMQCKQNWIEEPMKQKKKITAEKNRHFRLWLLISSWPKYFEIKAPQSGTETYINMDGKIYQKWCSASTCQTCVCLSSSCKISSSTIYLKMNLCKLFLFIIPNLILKSISSGILIKMGWISLL